MPDCAGERFLSPKRMLFAARQRVIRGYNAIRSGPVTIAACSNFGKPKTAGDWIVHIAGAIVVAMAAGAAGHKASGLNLSSCSYPKLGQQRVQSPREGKRPHFESVAKVGEDCKNFCRKLCGGFPIREE